MVEQQKPKQKNGIPMLSHHHHYAYTLLMNIKPNQINCDEWATHYILCGSVLFFLVHISICRFIHRVFGIVELISIGENLQSTYNTIKTVFVLLWINNAFCKRLFWSKYTSFEPCEQNEKIQSKSRKQHIAAVFKFMIRSTNTNSV